MLAVERCLKPLRKRNFILSRLRTVAAIKLASILKLERFPILKSSESSNYSTRNQNRFGFSHEVEYDLLCSSSFRDIVDYVKPWSDYNNSASKQQPHDHEHR